MSYHTGRMGLAEGLALVLITDLPRVFLTAPAQLLERAATTAWLTMLVAGAAALVALFALIHVVERVSGDLFTAAQYLLGRLGAWLVGLWCMAAFIANTVMLVRQFAENTLITALPALSLPAAVGWYVLGAAVVMYYGIENSARAGYIILPFAIAGLLGVLALLGSFYNVYNLAPWAGLGWGNALITGLATAGFNLGALVLPVLAPSFQNARTLRGAALFGLGGAVLVKTLSVLVFTMVFGVAVGREKILPFFEMARLVYVNRYLQHVEAFFIILWVIVGVLSIAISLYVALYLLCRLCNLRALRPLIPAATVLAGELALMPSDVVSVLRLEDWAVRYLFTWGLYGIPLLLLAALWLKGRQGKSRASRPE